MTCPHKHQRRPGGQAASLPRSAATKYSTIPNPHDPGALSVTDGTETIGTIVERDHSYFSFGRDGVLLGEFNTRTEAMRAIPDVDHQPKHRRR